MANRSPTIIDRADEVDTDLVPEPWDDRDAAEDQEIVTRRERYRLQGVTDGQGAGIVPAYNLNVADTEAIPSKTQDGWTRGSAGRVLNAQGKYVSHGSDVPRKSFDGENPGLLVEAASRTNHVHYSADYTQWANGGTTIDFASSILGGQNATAYKIINNGSQSDSVQNTAGSFSSSTEVIWAILEEGNSTSYEVGVRDTNNFNTIGGFIYDLQNDNIFPTGLSNTISVNKRTITDNGPNDGKVVLCVARYDPTDGVSVSGAGREAQHFPDTNGNSGNAIVHQTQIEEASNASSPIVTQGSPTTRSADDYSIFSGGQPSWWNSDEGTLIFEGVLKAYAARDNTKLLYGRSEGIRFFEVRETSSTTPWNVLTLDNDGAVLVNDAVTPFASFQAAVSFNQSKLKLSVNGSSDTSSSSGSMSSDPSTLSFEESGTSSSFVASKIIYIPRALPESTLNRITS